VLDAEIARQRAALGNGAQRRMFDDLSANRREEWLSDVARHRDAAQARYDMIRSGYRPSPAIGQTIGNLAVSEVSDDSQMSPGETELSGRAQQSSGFGSRPQLPYADVRPVFH